MSDSISTATVDRYGPPRTETARQVLAGTSFKHEHLAAILQNGLQDGFFEVHAENYMGAGGPPHHALGAIRVDYPLSIHGVCMSIGGHDALDTQHLRRFETLVRRYEPEFVSEHLAWSSHAGTFYNDLLPLPYTSETLRRVCAHIDQVQEAIRRPLLLENPSTYVAFGSSTMSEPEFIQAVAQRTGCGLLLDVNNVFVSAVNHGYSATAYLAEFPLGNVREIHLAGHSEQRDDEDAPLLIDSHDRAISDEVWKLYEEVLARTGPIPTLIEWDSKLPEWPGLRAQAQKAHSILMRQAKAAAGTFGHAV
ncbi:MNIO family bufferin maturase [Paraburkholderia oxyphila]|uniref:MNIO family bufferin maturase n=1 Tax=Paraburkholderia oxyphila TaxID=614212 RepID=UPI000488DBE9|nr:DUF692 domain-containing protein [Paraburkholderia oxyphila]